MDEPETEGTGGDGDDQAEKDPGGSHAEREEGGNVREGRGEEGRGERGGGIRLRWRGGGRRRGGEERLEKLKEGSGALAVLRKERREKGEIGWCEWGSSEAGSEILCQNLLLNFQS